MLKIDLLSLFAKISIDSSAFEAGINKAVDAAKGLGSAVSGAVSAVADMSLDFVKSSVEVGKSFDTAMSQVAATAGKTMDELEGEVGSVDTSFGHFEGTLRDFAKYMGSNTAFSATEAAEALNYMALAGYDAQTSMSMLPNVLNLAAAGAMELGSASDMITDVSSALGLTIDETSQLVDKMATAAASSNTSVAALGDALLTVGGTAKNMAGGTTEMATVLGLLADNGVKASEGGTALRNILLNLTPKSDDAAAAMERIGLQAYDAEGKMRPMQDIFLEMNESMKDMSDLERQNILATIFNKVDLKSVEALLGTSKERWEELTAKIDESGRVGGAAAQMAATQLDNLEGDLTLFGSALEGLQIAINDGVSPALRDFVQFGADGLSRLTAAIEEGGVLGAAEELGTIFVDGLQLITDKLPGFVEAGATVISSIVQGLADHSEEIFTAIGNLILEMAQMMMSSDGLRAIFESVGTIIGNFADAIIQFTPMITSAAIGVILALADYFLDPEGIEKVIETAVQVITTLADGMSSVLSTLIPVAISAILTLIEKLTDAESVGDLIDAALQIVMAIADGLIDALPEIIEATPRIVQQIVDTIVDNLPKIISVAFDIVMALVGAVIDNAPEMVGAATEIVMSFLAGITSLFFELGNVGSEMIQQIKTAIESFDPFQWGKDLLQNFIDGIKSKFNVLGDVMAKIGEGVANNIGFSEPKEGPLSNFHTFAPDMMELFAQGIRDNEAMLKGTVTEAFDFENAITAPTMAIPEMSKSTAGGAGEDLADIASMLAMYLPRLAEMNLYIDEDTLIGSTVRGYDTSIDRLQVQKGREGFGTVVSS